MRKKSKKLFRPQFIVDDKGKKKAVVMDIKLYERLMESLEDLYLGNLAEQILKTEKEFHDYDEIKNELLAH